MKLYYSPDYNLHFGFETSLENKERLDSVIAKLNPTPLERGDFELKLRSNLKKYLKKLGERFSEKPMNCIHCTFPINSHVCDMCGLKSSRVVKFISDLEGETSYMCDSSEKCITSLLVGIYGVIEGLRSTPLPQDRRAKLDLAIPSFNQNIFILSRPPGHHCDNENPSGFCLVNNIAFATDVLLGLKVDRICIIDWDVHHGNGTEKLFYDTDQVLFIDIHRENFYPYTGKSIDTGSGKGKGYTMNFPLPKGSGEKEYLEAFVSFLPKVEEYKPEFILVSCGFDAHKNDPIGGMKLESESYGKFHTLLKKFNVPIVYFLEGGYDPKIIEDSVVCILEAD